MWVSEWVKLSNIRRRKLSKARLCMNNNIYVGFEPKKIGPWSQTNLHRSRVRFDFTCELPQIGDVSYTKHTHFETQILKYVQIHTRTLQAHTHTPPTETRVRVFDRTYTSTTPILTSVPPLCHLSRTRSTRAAIFGCRQSFQDWAATACDCRSDYKEFGL